MPWWLMTYLLGGTSGVFTASTAEGHSADISTYVVTQRQGLWVLHVSLATAGLRRGLWLHAGVVPEGLQSAAEQGAIVQLIRAGVRLVIDGGPVALRGGGVRVGGHQTDLLFTLPSAPKTPHSLLQSRISGLSAVPNQHNVLRLVVGDKRAQWVLAARNDFTLTAKVPASVGSDELLVRGAASGERAPAPSGWWWRVVGLPADALPALLLALSVLLLPTMLLTARRWRSRRSE